MPCCGSQRDLFKINCMITRWQTDAELLPCDFKHANMVLTLDTMLTREQLLGILDSTWPLPSVPLVCPSFAFLPISRLFAIKLWVWLLLSKDVNNASRNWPSQDHLYFSRNPFMSNRFRAQRNNFQMTEFHTCRGIVSHLILLCAIFLYLDHKNYAMY